MLDPDSDLSEVLWIFSRLKDEDKRLSLKQNPHFYEGLPTSPEAFGGDFRMDPIESFQHETIRVLVDNPDHAGRVFLETEGRMRAFGNVWVPSNAIIFKGSCLLFLLFSVSDTLLDVCGKLEGESIVGGAIQGIPNVWCFEEPRQSLASQSALSPSNRNNPSLTATATRITSEEGMLIPDWNEPIRRMLQSRDDINIRITDKQPRGSSYATASP